MTAKELKYYREQLAKIMIHLDAERKGLKEEAMQGTGGESSGGISSLPIHLGDLGSHEAEEDMDFRLLENEEELMREVDAALDRIDQGTYGQCDSCQKPVAKERLKVIPYARYCIKCATQLEGKK